MAPAFAPTVSAVAVTEAAAFGGSGAFAVDASGVSAIGAAGQLWAVRPVWERPPPERRISPQAQEPQPERGRRDNGLRFHGCRLGLFRRLWRRASAYRIWRRSSLPQRAMISRAWRKALAFLRVSVPKRGPSRPAFQQREHGRLLGDDRRRPEMLAPLAWQQRRPLARQPPSARRDRFSWAGFASSMGAARTEDLADFAFGDCAICFTSQCPSQTAGRLFACGSACLPERTFTPCSKGRVMARDRNFTVACNRARVMQSDDRNTTSVIWLLSVHDICGII